MLNWIWLGLIVIAIAVATGRDISEIASDRFHNGGSLALHVTDLKQTSPDHFTTAGFITKNELAHFYSSDEIKNIKADTLRCNLEVVGKRSADGKIIGAVVLNVPDDAPTLWKDMASSMSDNKTISGKGEFFTGDSTRIGSLVFTPEPVRFRILNKVANDGILKAAETAVTLALGLIGVMAFWLGMMKIAEAAGFVALLAKMAKPIMVRLFPEVPPDHPAMGAMLSNMAANFLGMSNAATPLGLKAMEELNKLNPNVGTATNAMCLFLTINTSAITLVPATVIAVRLSLGSHEPADIIVPTFLATLIALTCGVFFNRFIQRFFPVK